jgi:hypothetical protein
MDKQAKKSGYNDPAHHRGYNSVRAFYSLV